MTETNVRCNLTAIMWKDTQNVDILMDMHSATLEGNICNEHSKAVTLDIYNKTIIDTQNMWTDLSTFQTVTVLADQLGCGERTFLPSSVPYHSQQLYQSHILWFKIIALTITLTLVRDLIQEVGMVP